MQHGLGLEVPLAEIRCRVVPVDAAVLLQVEHHPGGRGAVQGEAGDLLLAEPVAEGAAAIGLLDAAGERALAAHAGAVGVGEARAREGARREDERGRRREGGHGGGGGPGGPPPAARSVLAIRYRPALTTASPDSSRVVTVRSSSLMSRYLRIDGSWFGHCPGYRFVASRRAPQARLTPTILPQAPARVKVRGRSGPSARSRR